MSNAKDDTLFWTYIGRRFVKSGTMRHCFVDRDDHDTLRWFNKVQPSRFQGCVIGREYALETTLPQFWQDIETGKSASEKAALKWQALDRATEMEKRQKSVKPSPELDALVVDLKNFRLRLSPVQKAGFDAWLLNSIR